MAKKITPAILLVRALERPSLKAFEALLATFAEVIFFAIYTSFLFYEDILQVFVIIVM